MLKLAYSSFFLHWVSFASFASFAVQDLEVVNEFFPSRFKILI